MIKQKHLRIYKLCIVKVRMGLDKIACLISYRIKLNQFSSHFNKNLTDALRCGHSDMSIWPHNYTLDRHRAYDAIQNAGYTCKWMPSGCIEVDISG